jgi:hypothetical protein
MLLPHSSAAARPVTLPIPAAAVTAGIAPGTRVLTDQGDLPVEHLFAGDRVAVPGGGFATLRRVERVRTLGLATSVLEPGALPGQTGALTLPLGQPVLNDDWRTQVLHGGGPVLVPVGGLTDDALIRRETRAVQTLLRLVFDRPVVIRAEGAWIGCATPRPLEAARPARLH